MYGNGDDYPGARFKITFLSHHEAENFIRADVLDVKIQNPSYDNSSSYKGKNQLHEVETFIFYDYDALNPMNHVMKEISERREIPSLSSMAQSRLSTRELEQAKARGILGGLKTRKRRKRRKQRKQRKSNKKTSSRK